MKTITMADFYNAHALFQRNLVEHEYDHLLEKFTLEEFVDAVTEVFNTKGRLNMLDVDDYPAINVLWELDTACRDVFYKIIIEIGGCNETFN